MKIRKSLLATAGILLAAFSGMAFAGAKPQKQTSPAVTRRAVQKPDSQSTIGVSQGTIISINSTELVQSHSKNGASEKLTFMLSPATARTGNLTSGAQVTIHYRTENNHLMATAIQAMPQPTAGKVKNPVGKK